MVAMKDKAERANRAKPVHGEYVEAVGVGWQHGRRPSCPSGMSRPTQEAWKVWFGAWFASFWEPEDLPGLRLMIGLYDVVARSKGSASAQTQHELKRLMDEFGITRTGQMARRWKRPSGSVPAVSAPTGEAPPKKSRYSGLVVVDSVGAVDDDVAS